MTKTGRQKRQAVEEAQVEETDGQVGAGGWLAAGGKRRQIVTQRRQEGAGDTAGGRRYLR